MSRYPPPERVNSDFQEPVPDETAVDITNGTTNGKDQPQPKPKRTLLDWVKIIVKYILNVLMQWGSLISLLIIPQYAGYTVGYAVSLTWSVAAQVVEFILWRRGTVKVWPKLLSFGIILLSIALLIIEVTQHPDAEFHKVYSGIIVQAGLTVIVLFSIIIGKPFTVQFAKETTPEQQWKSPIFLKICKVTAYFWLLLFILMLIVDCSPLFSSSPTVYEVSKFLPILIMVTGLHVTKLVAASIKKKEMNKAMQQGEQGQVQKEVQNSDAIEHQMDNV